MIKEINFTFGVAVSGNQRKFLNTNCACLAWVIATCKNWHHVIFT